MDSFQVFILLMFAATILVGVSQRIRVPYPIGLIFGGIILGFSPKVNVTNFDPGVILMIVLPPILYYAAFGISFREFKRNFTDILSLALGLVIFTTFVVGMLFKWLFPELPWAMAFAFGAIVSPPDAIAATTILKRFSIHTHLLTVLEGESLVNDAVALILYRLAVVALLTGTFSMADGAVAFFQTVLGGILVGLVLGYVMQKFSKHFLEPAVGVIFSFTIPYVTYFLADFLGGSGVLAVVVNGLAGSQILLRHHSSLRRILGYVAWDIFAILLNCFVFVLIGLQLHNLTTVMSSAEMVRYGGYGILIALSMIVIRLLWVLVRSIVPYLKALQNPRADILCPQIFREAILVGWSGMRGIVSLTAALALPLTLSDGAPLEGRSEVIFITFVVILLSLLIPGFTLAPLIRSLNIGKHAETHILVGVRRELKKASDSAVNDLHATNRISDVERQQLISYFNVKFYSLTGTQANLHPQRLFTIESAKSVVIQAQRKKLLEMWESFEVDDKLLNQLEHELDLEETPLARAELN